MSARDMYLMQIIKEHKLNNENLEEVYDIVRKHFEEVELTKITLEKMIWKKKYDATQKEEMAKIQDELKEYLQNQGENGLKMDDFLE